MSDPAYPTVLCGFGAVAAGVVRDKRMARHIKYQAHAQVLRDHPAFEFRAVVDPDPEARRSAREEWGVPIVVARPEDLPADFAPTVAVLATPPDPREALLRALPSVRAAVVEKPIAERFESTLAFEHAIRERDVICQVNLFRRTERTYRDLINAPLRRYIGAPQTATVLYGNGLLNNGLHMIDLARMLLGEVREARALAPPRAPTRAPTRQTIPGDFDIAAALTFEAGFVLTLHPIDFAHHRDVLLDIWGTAGRVEIYQEGLRLRHSPLRDHRAVDGAMEIAIDDPTDLPSYCGTAYYQLFDDLAEALATGRPVGSPLENAMRSEAVVDAIRRSAAHDGLPVAPRVPTGDGGWSAA